MSMVRLLTAGKCLVGLKDSTARYRMANAKALPKFESNKNPFRSTTRAPLTEAQQTLLLAPDPEPQTSTVVEPKPTPQPAQTPTPASASSTDPKATPISTPPVRKLQIETGRGPGGATISAPIKPLAPTRATGGWIPRLTAALKSKFGKAQTSRPAGASRRGPARPVQGELSLDKVKVCCNDLSDSDVEVVAAPAAAKRAKAPTAFEAVGVE